MTRFCGPITSARVWKRTTEREAYIPDDHGPWRPFEADLEVLTQSDVVVKELQQKVALFLLVSDDVAGNCCANVNGFTITGNGVTCIADSRRLLSRPSPARRVRMYTGNPKSTNPQGASEPVGVSKSPASSAQCFLGSHCFEPARFLGSKN